MREGMTYIRISKWKRLKYLYRYIYFLPEIVAVYVSKFLYYFPFFIPVAFLLLI
jgi:hypothetical protein